MASSVNGAFFRGCNAKLKAYQNGRPVVFLCKNFDVEENASENNDGVCGEDRDRLDKVTNYFSVSVDLYQKDQELMNAIIAAQEADDAAGFPLPQTCAIEIQQRNGTRVAYLLTECKFGPFKWSNSSRDEAVMVNLKIRGRYWKPVAAI